jgi:hypothetical protein
MVSKSDGHQRRIRLQVEPMDRRFDIKHIYIAVVVSHLLQTIGWAEQRANGSKHSKSWRGSIPFDQLDN